jgi:PRC-barrel domain
MPPFGAPAQCVLSGSRRGKAEQVVLVALALFAAQAPASAATRNRQPLAGPLSWHLAQAASSPQPSAAAPAPQPATAPPAPQPATAPPAPQNDENTKEEKTSVPATVVGGEELESVLGIEAFSSTGDDMGRIVDIIVDRTGQIRAAIIDFGGFLGVGSRKIAVDWRSLHFDPKKAGAVVVNLTKDQLRVAPVYKAAEPVVMVGGPGVKP